MIQNYVPLVRAIITASLFLEQSSDDEVDLHCAVRCMENMADDLLKLSDADQLALRAEIERIAEESGHPYRDGIYALPDQIGLIPK